VERAANGTEETPSPSLATKLSRSLARSQRCRGDEMAKPLEWRNYQNTRKPRSKARRNWKTQMAKVATRKRGERKTRNLPHCPALFNHSDFPSIQLHELWIRLCGWLSFAQPEASTFHPLIRWKIRTPWIYTTLRTR
jgi:hypothetical protein